MDQMIDLPAPADPPPEDDPDDWEDCPACEGQGLVLSDRPGYLFGCRVVCPTCHGEGEVPPTDEETP